ncbi:hypothetical protein [Thauera humireducens]|uniref:Uncharacterized protein n=1 Tax=Thauera humireducens TaxID=1134435 RepID=A0A127K373_9RHOO|nr:hypothetical protein [Thauera humireducens]AMO36412.1 hypothetical protein AC731_005355 [Thauera humireducens]
MASANFGKFALNLASGAINFNTDSFKCLLVTAAPNEAALDTWNDRADVTGEHAATGGYPAGGFEVTVASVVEDAANNRVAITFSAPDPTLTGVTLAGVVGAILYKSTGVAANDPLLSFVDYGSAKGVTSGSFTHAFTTPLYINR